MKKMASLMSYFYFCYFQNKYIIILFDSARFWSTGYIIVYTRNPKLFNENKNAYAYMIRNLSNVMKKKRSVEQNFGFYRHYLRCLLHINKERNERKSFKY